MSAFGDSPSTRFFEGMRGMLRTNIEQALQLWKDGRDIRGDFVAGNAQGGIAAITQESKLVKDFLTTRIDNYDDAMKVRWGRRGWRCCWAALHIARCAAA